MNKMMFIQTNGLPKHQQLKTNKYPISDHFSTIFNHSVQEKHQKITIILTSTVIIKPNVERIYQIEKQERVNTYIKSINRWLNETTFTIVLVENSGYEFNELSDLLIKYKDRFELIQYNEAMLSEADYLQNMISKGASELFAINYAHDNSILIKQSDFIIKITCRFFIPDLQSYLSKIDIKQYFALRQNNPGRCEMVGARSDFFAIIFQKNIINSLGKMDNHVENIYKERIQKLSRKHIIVCKEFKIEPTQRGGVDQIYYII